MRSITRRFCHLGTTVILVTSSMAGHSQPVKRSSANQELKTQLEANNRRMEYYYRQQNADSIVSFYDKEFTYLPEYKPVIKETDELKKFYTDWFASLHIESYNKKIYQVEKIGAYMLEIGNFSMKYSTTGSAATQYTGKYMIMWKRNSAGKWKILSEAFGSDKYIKPEDIPYATVEVRERDVLDKNILNPKLLPELEKFDRDAVKAILGGDGEARAGEFTNDGIYMPHFDPMQAGMGMIRPYMIKTYKPGIIRSVRDTYREIFDLGEFVFLSGHFKVSVDNGSSKGTFEGNMSNLMKRGRDGKLRMYRQLAHN